MAKRCDSFVIAGENVDHSRMDTLNRIRNAVAAAKNGAPRNKKMPLESRSDQVNASFSRQTALIGRDARGRVLPGNNLNPGGRPKGIAAEARELLTELDWQECVREIMVDERSPPALQLEVLKLLLDRGHGKAVAVTVNADATPEQVAGLLDPTALPPDAQRRYLDLAKKAAALRAQLKPNQEVINMQPVYAPQQAGTPQEGK